jgi:hypothetical protein
MGLAVYKDHLYYKMIFNQVWVVLNFFKKYFGLI